VETNKIPPKSVNHSKVLGAVASKFRMKVFWVQKRLRSKKTKAKNFRMISSEWRMTCSWKAPIMSIIVIDKVHIF